MSLGLQTGTRTCEHWRSQRDVGHSQPWIERPLTLHRVVLVQNKKPQTTGLNNGNFLLTVLQAGKSTIKVPADFVPSDHAGLRTAPSCCVLTWPFLGACPWREKDLSLLLLL